MVVVPIGGTPMVAFLPGGIKRGQSRQMPSPGYCRLDFPGALMVNRIVGRNAADFLVMRKQVNGI
jgi:hypothetical protein